MSLTYLYGRQPMANKMICRRVNGALRRVMYNSPRFSHFCERQFMQLSLFLSNSRNFVSFLFIGTPKAGLDANK